MFNLWSMTEKQETINGRDYNVQYYKKERVLAKTMEKAVSKAPEGAEWCEWLVDYRWPTTRRKQLIDNHTQDTFFFGKYFGKRFDEIEDADYLRWYHSKVEFEDQKATIEDILSRLGYVNVDGEMVSPEKYNKEMYIKKMLRKTRMELDTMTPHVIECKYSLNGEGKIFGEEGVVFVFDCKYQCYDGMWYGLPFDRTGAAKRIKGKKIAILSSKLINDDEIHPVYKVTAWDFC